MGKKRGRKGKKGKKRGKKGKKGRKMSTGKKLLIGAGVAAVAVGGLYLGKKIYDSRKKKAGATRDIQFDNSPPPPALAPFMKYADTAVYETSNATIPIPDAVTIGLGWDEDVQANFDLIAAVFNQAGQNVGYVQGKQNFQRLFNNAIYHTGDDVDGSVTTVLSDNENIVADLRALPADVAHIMVGVYLVDVLNIQSARAYIHLLPMMREEQIQSQIAAGGTRSIDWESDSDSDSDDEAQSGTRGVEGSGHDPVHDFIKLYHDELDRYPGFYQQRGFVAGRISRQGASWTFTPYRLTVQSDPNYGVWPAFDHYAKQAQNSTQQQAAPAPFQQVPEGYAPTRQGSAPYGQ